MTQPPAPPLTAEEITTVMKRHLFDDAHRALSERRAVETAWDICHSDRWSLLATITDLERKLAEEERDHEKSLEERDFAQSCLQQAHIDLGGDGEWTAKVGQLVQPPHTGDLHYDVPALAADVLARAEKAEARIEQLELALAEACPEEPMNQDEQGGCVWCGGSGKRSMYATSNPKHHGADCAWLKARTLLAPATKENGRE